jgi:RNA polymerase sigma-70 factor (ECF subfamily)
VLTALQGDVAESASALDAICRSYWYPLYAYARRSGQSPQDAQDITQEFFRLLLEKRWLQDADRDKGHLRSFLITALKRFMAKEWRRVCSQKRGSGKTHFVIDTQFAESRYAADPSCEYAAEEMFDREWALKLLALTIERLHDEFERAGKQHDFAVLKDFLAVSHENIDYADAAARLGQSQGATRVAVHRLRKRFRVLYRDEVAQTLPDGENLEAELRYLADVLARS